MSERPDSYFQLFTGDYLRDTMHLTTRQHGAYMLLLMHYYGTMKPLPLNEETLRTICRLSEKEWGVDGPVVLPFFTRENDGWHQKRVDKEIISAGKRYDRAVKAAVAKHGSKQPPSSLQAHTQAADKHLLTGCLDGANPNPNPNHSRKNPLQGSSTSGGRKAAAHGKAAQPPAASNWEKKHPKWADFREKVGEPIWLNWFDQCRTNGSETTILAPSEFAADQLVQRYLPALRSHFGATVFIKFDPEQWNPKEDK